MLNNIPAAFRRSAATVALASIAFTGCAASAVFAAPQRASAAELAVGATAAVAAPAGLAATPGNGSLAVKWTASTDTTVTGYSIQVSSDPSFATGTTTTVVSGRTAVSKTITGLAASTTYSVRIASTSAAGVGDYSAAVSASTFSTPGAPASPKMTAGNKSFTVSWAAPTVTGGSAVTGYQVDYSTDATFASGVTSVNLGKVSSATVTGLQDGVTYYGRVQAINAVGAGTESAVVSTKTFYLPAVPTSVTATGAKASATVRWVAPADKGGTTLSGYLIEYSKDANFAAVAGSVTATSTATSAVVSGLDNGTGYYFRVSAKNVIGQGASTVPVSAVTFNVPGTVSNVTAAGGNASIALKWTAPTVTGGSAITGYRVQYSTAADFSSNVTTVDTLSTSAAYTIKNIPAGQTVYARVAALNTVGAGTYISAASSATAFTVPGVATSVTAAKGAGLITVKWVAPANKGGTTLSNYTVQVSTDAAFSSIAAQVTASAAAVSANVPGLQPATTYYARVIANNVVGAGQASASASAVTSALPGAPTSLVSSPVAGAGSVKLTWKASTVLDGGAVTGYSIQYSKDASFASGVNTIKQTGSTASSTVTGLDFSSKYYFRVATITGAGTGSYSSSVSSTTVAATSAVQNLGGYSILANGVGVTWNAPVSVLSPVTGYEVRISTSADMSNAQVQTITDPSGQSAYFDGLSPLTTYYAQVTPLTASGNGTSASVSVKTIADQPSAPQNFRYTPNGSSGTFSWAAPADTKGAAITSYRVIASLSDGNGGWGPGLDVTVPGDQLSYTITGLAPKVSIMYINVYAINEYGTYSVAADAPNALALAPNDNGSWVGSSYSPTGVNSWSPDRPVLVQLNVFMGDHYELMKWYDVANNSYTNSYASGWSYATPPLDDGYRTSNLVGGAFSGQPYGYGSWISERSTVSDTNYASYPGSF